MVHAPALFPVEALAASTAGAEIYISADTIEPATEAPATKAADMLKDGIIAYDKKVSGWHVIFNQLFGKKLPARELQSEEDMKQLAFDMQAMMNSEGDQIAKMAQGAESNRNEGENESILREPLHLQGKFDLQKGKVAYLWKRHLRQNPESREKYAGAGKDYEKKREIPAQWNQDEWKLTKVALTNHGRQTSNEI